VFFAPRHRLLATLAALAVTALAGCDARSELPEGAPSPASPAARPATRGTSETIVTSTRCAFVSTSGPAMIVRIV
jgi:hypothetical protein